MAYYTRRLRVSVSMPLHVPGYRYLGPGTSDLSAKPVNRLDAIAREHDLNYGNPNVATADADQVFIDKARKEGLLGNFAAAVISGKRTLDTVVNTDALFRDMAPPPEKRAKMDEAAAAPQGEAPLSAEGRASAGSLGGNANPDGGPTIMKRTFGRTFYHYVQNLEKGKVTSERNAAAHTHNLEWHPNYSIVPYHHPRMSMTNADHRWLELNARAFRIKKISWTT